MAKLVLNDITSGYASITALNDNFARIETALENTVSRDGKIPNQMTADFDLNGKSILNVTKINDIDANLLGNLAAYVDSATASATSALDSKNSAATSATAAANSATQSQSYSVSAADSAANAAAIGSLALSVSNAYDFGFVTETVSYFSTDFGSIA